MAPFFNWRGIKQESERQRVGERETERGDARRREERGRRVGRGGGRARNEKLGGGGKQHSGAQVAERAECSRGPEPSGRRAREPGPAPPALGPRWRRPPGGGGDDQLGARRSPVFPRAPSPGEPRAASRRRERSATSGGGERLPRRSPGLGESANIFQTTQTFLLSPRSGVSLEWNCSPESRGAPGRDRSPRFLGGWANFADSGPVALAPRRSPALLPCSGGPKPGLFASERTPNPAPLGQAVEPPAPAAGLETAD